MPRRGVGGDASTLIVLDVVRMRPTGDVARLSVEELRCGGGDVPKLLVRDDVDVSRRMVTPSTLCSAASPRCQHSKHVNKGLLWIGSVDVIPFKRSHWLIMKWCCCHHAINSLAGIVHVL